MEIYAFLSMKNHGVDYMKKCRIIYSLEFVRKYIYQFLSIPEDWKLIFWVLIRDASVRRISDILNWFNKFLKHNCTLGLSPNWNEERIFFNLTSAVKIGTEIIWKG